jgi:Na+/melibiose symporter-like transporter
LPVLLCLFSFIFVMRYTLTEKRSHEIKELLRLRSIERANGNGASSEPSVI